MDTAWNSLAVILSCCLTHYDVYARMVTKKKSPTCTPILFTCAHLVHLVTCILTYVWSIIRSCFFQPWIFLQGVVWALWRSASSEVIHALLNFYAKVDERAIKAWSTSEHTKVFLPSFHTSVSQGAPRSELTRTKVWYSKLTQEARGGRSGDLSRTEFEFLR